MRGPNAGMVGAPTHGGWVWLLPSLRGAQQVIQRGRNSETWWVCSEGQAQDQSPSVSLRTPLWALCRSSQAHPSPRLSAFLCCYFLPFLFTLCRPWALASNCPMRPEIDPLPFILGVCTLSFHYLECTVLVISSGGVIISIRLIIILFSLLFFHYYSCIFLVIVFIYFILL